MCMTADAACSKSELQPEFLIATTTGLIRLSHGCAHVQEMVLFLQKPPTSTWSESEVELILSRAYMWRASFNDARSHLVS